MVKQLITLVAVFTQMILPKQADVTLSQALGVSTAYNSIAKAAVLMCLRPTVLHTARICICILCYKALTCAVHQVHSRECANV